MDLGVIGNCAVAALVSREGAINWFCLPRFDGDPVFHSLMGHGAGEEGDGEFAVELEDMTESAQSYLPNTATCAPCCAAQKARSRLSTSAPVSPPMAAAFARRCWYGRCGVSKALPVCGCA